MCMGAASPRLLTNKKSVFITKVPSSRFFCVGKVLNLKCVLGKLLLGKKKKKERKGEKKKNLILA